MSGFVELKDVHKIYQMGEVEIRAVDGIDFSIDQGEFVVIVGPSGAGKTTVLNILGGMDKASSGSVMVDGKNVAEYSNKELTRFRRDDIGFIIWCKTLPRKKMWNWQLRFVKILWRRFLY